MYTKKYIYEDIVQMWERRGREMAKQEELSSKPKWKKRKKEKEDEVEKERRGGGATCELMGGWCYS